MKTLLLTLSLASFLFVGDVFGQGGYATVSSTYVLGNKSNDRPNKIVITYTDGDVETIEMESRMEIEDLVIALHKAFNKVYIKGYRLATSSYLSQGNSIHHFEQIED